MINYKKQQGVVLLVSIILLLVITIISISAARSTAITTQVVGNNMFSMLAFNGAESALARTASNNDLSNISSALASPSSMISVPSIYLPEENITAGSKLISQAQVEYMGQYDCPISSIVTSSTIECKFFSIDALSHISAVNTRDRHIKGVGLSAP